jgi:AcrR family transcriptional regulator
MRRSGRRPGTPDTRRAILEAARRAFAARGYRATTFRSIAEIAGVDPALLTHYFGSKEGLFAAALEFPVRPSELFAGLETKTAAEASQHIVRSYFAMVDEPRARDALLALVRSAVSDERAAALLREFVAEELLTLIAQPIRRPDAQLRASLAAAQLVGIAMLRYVIQISPLAEASNDDLVSLVAPAIEAYLR